MTLDSVKGYMLAALAAAAYGTNPAFAIPLYDNGMNPVSVLLFRYLLGVPLLAVLIVWRGHTLRLRRHEHGAVAILGILMALSSLSLFESYRYINSGIASTLLFVYPVMVAVLMIFFFHERFRLSTGICLVLMCAGLAMLMRTPDGGAISPYGTLLVMVSALTYALYIVMVNVSHVVRGIPTSRLMMYLLLWGSAVFAAVIACGTPLTVPHGVADWSRLGALAVIPTVLSLACTTKAIHAIGSTPTAILGALEPVSAIILSVAFLGQTFTMRDIAGTALILTATTLVVADRRVDRVILAVRRLFPRRHRDRPDDF